MDRNINTAEKARILKNIQKNGCHITHIEGNHNHPSFTYSLGIEKNLNHPEILITGMEKDNAHFLINEYNYRIKDGEVFKADGFYEEFLEDAQVTFKVIDTKHHEQYFKHSAWLYDERHFRALHLIWPDIDGTWPWEKRASKEYRWLIPRLYKK